MIRQTHTKRLGDGKTRLPVIIFFFFLSVLGRYFPLFIVHDLMDIIIYGALLEK